MKVLQPRYTMPSRRHFTIVAIPDICRKVKEAMDNFFAGIDYLNHSFRFQQNIDSLTVSYL